MKRFVPQPILLFFSKIGGKLKKQPAIVCKFTFIDEEESVTVFYHDENGKKITGLGTVGNSLVSHKEFSKNPTKSTVNMTSHLFDEAEIYS